MILLWWKADRFIHKRPIKTKSSVLRNQMISYKKKDTFTVNIHKLLNAIIVTLYVFAFVIVSIMLVICDARKCPIIWKL